MTRNGWQLPTWLYGSPLCESCLERLPPVAAAPLGPGDRDARLCPSCSVALEAARARDW